MYGLPEGVRHLFRIQSLGAAGFSNTCLTGILKAAILIGSRKNKGYEQHREIVYRDFYDAPRMFVVRYQDRQILFECKFDEKADDYSQMYKVYVLPDLDDAVLQGTWENLSRSATQFLGEVPVNEVRFDSSRRREIDGVVLDRLMHQADHS